MIAPHVAFLSLPIFSFKIPPFPANIRAAFREEMKRTHHCNELRPAHIGQTVTLSGWVHSRRDLGGLIFIDVRDREGRTQTVFDPSDLPKDLFEQAAALRSECVISVTGKVRPRPAGTNNPKILTERAPEAKVERPSPIVRDDAAGLFDEERPRRVVLRCGEAHIHTRTKKRFIIYNSETRRGGRTQIFS